LPQDIFFAVAISVRPRDYGQAVVQRVSSPLLSVAQDEINGGEEVQMLRVLSVLHFPCESQAGKLFQMLCDYHAGDSLDEFVDFVENMMRLAFMAGVRVNPKWRRELFRTE